MKKIFFTLLTCCCIVSVEAQKEVTLKAGTIVPLKSIANIRAANVNEGQIVDFAVTQDIMVDGVCVIPRSTLVKGTITEAKKSTIAGTKGRLGISINRLNLQNGEPVFFTNTNVQIHGKNRTPLAVVTALFFTPCIFIPGSRAEMPAGYEVFATVGSNVTTTIK